MKIIKKNKKFVKIMTLTGIYAILSIIISVLVIHYINNLIIINTGDLIKNNFGSDKAKSSIGLNESSVKLDNSSSTKSANTSKINECKISSIPSNPVNISFSYDGRYCVYLYDNKIYIKDITSDITTKKISDDAPIINFILINDRNIIIYFTLKGGLLNIKTYDITNDIETLQKTIKISNDAKVKNVDYSSLTNLIFINMENGSGVNLKSTLYYLNIMKRLKTIQLKTIINNIVLLNKTFTLYYEDYQNILYCYPNPIKSVKGLNVKKINLIGCDLNDNVYIQSLDDKHVIYVLKDGNIRNIINLSNLDYIKFYVDKIGIYVVYNNYIINLAGDINKKVTFNNNLKFMGIGGDKIYFKDLNNNIFWGNLDI
ncbi:MAG: hypothetical protein M1326_04265 [Cyanobacteria bacterium]|nr:hypothetical protein [Cyanobacteriota bacterium]